MYDPIVVEVRNAVEELPEERFENSERELTTSRRMVVKDLLHILGE